MARSWAGEVGEQDIVLALGGSRLVWVGGKADDIFQLERAFRDASVGNVWGAREPELTQEETAEKRYF